MHFAPKGDGPALTVLLTPGPYNETYFEHALLARYLGFPLVEGGDLTVRKAARMAEDPGRPQRVHAILRRQDDVYCDPLELRSDSALGVAGLTDCARRGSVLSPTRLGSGVIESGALLGFLPRLCEQLTGEALRLPSIATWWCGEPAALADALEQPKQLVFKSARPGLRVPAGFRRGPGRGAAGRSANAANSRSAISRRNSCMCRRRRCSRAPGYRIGARGDRPARVRRALAAPATR